MKWGNIVYVRCYFLLCYRSFVETQKQTDQNEGQSINICSFHILHEHNQSHTRNGATATLVRSLEAKMHVN